MRVIVGALTGVLLLIGLGGIALGIAAALTTELGAGADPLHDLMAALVAGVVPLSIGTVALGAAVITLAVDQSRADIVTALRGGSVPGDRQPDRNASDWR